MIEQKLAAIRKVLSENMEAADVEQVIEQAEVYVEEMVGKTMVVKCSGFVLANDLERRNFVAEIACLKEVGINPIVVYGGGEQINQKLKEQGIKSEFYNGLRVTDSATMEVVEDILMGIGRSLCADINSRIDSSAGFDIGGERAPSIAEDIYKARAVLVTGAIQAVPLNEKLGLVGKVVGVETDKLVAEISNGNILVVPCLGVSENGEFLNVNADTAASKVAVGVEVERLHFLTNVDGIYSDFVNAANGSAGKGQVISELKVEAAKQMVADKLIDGGMLPKIEACIAALDSDLKENTVKEHTLKAAHILNGTTSNNLLLELFTDAGIGTMIRSENVAAENAPDKSEVVENEVAENAQ